MFTKLHPLEFFLNIRRKKLIFFGGGGDLLKNLFHLPKTLVASTQMVMPC